MKRRSKTLSAGEMEIMNMLWQQGPVTLSEAHRTLGRDVGYTTVQTRLNRLVKKRIVARSPDRPAKYQAAIAPEEVSAGHLDVLLERVSGGSIIPLVAHLVSDRSLTREEIEELKRLIEEAEQAIEHRKQVKADTTGMNS